MILIFMQIICCMLLLVVLFECLKNPRFRGIQFVFPVIVGMVACLYGAGFTSYYLAKGIVTEVNSSSKVTTQAIVQTPVKTIVIHPKPVPFPPKLDLNGSMKKD